LEKVLCRFGSCAEIITGVALSFLENSFSCWSQVWLTAEEMHPQANGLAERAVQTIERALKKFCEKIQTPKLWDKTMTWLVIGYICSHQASTKMSPYFMLYARHLITLLLKCTISPCQ
jgi:hypothetical protein